MKQDAIGFSVAFAIAVTGLRLLAGAPQATIDLPAGARPRHLAIPLARYVRSAPPFVFTGSIALPAPITIPTTSLISPSLR